MGNIMTCKINADTTDGLKIVSDTSGVVEIQDNGTTRVTVGDNVGIGTSSNLTGKINLPESDYGEGINVFSSATEANRCGIGHYAYETRVYYGGSDNLTFVDGGPSGTERMRIDTSGRITTPAQPAFSGYVTGTNSYSTAGVVAINNTAINIGSHFDTSTDRFTAPVAGLYMISYGAHSENDSNPKLIHIYKNGGVLAHGSTYSQNNTYQSMSKTIVASLAANDYIQLYLAAGTVWGGDNQTGIGWDIYLLG
jgi:hypothetical protein